MKNIFIALLLIISACLFFACFGDEEEEDCFAADERCANSGQCCDGYSCQYAYSAGDINVYTCQEE